jgi:formylglycine-generating enzyme required for sulfatase activity
MLSRFLAFGVTSVRDLHHQQDSILALYEETALGAIKSPRLYVAGAMIDGAPGSRPDATLVSDPDAPRHQVFLQPFELASRLVTCGEYLEFLQDGGYRRPELWLSEGWDAVHAQAWTAPLYWEARDGEWWEFTLHGMRRQEIADEVYEPSFGE